MNFDQWAVWKRAFVLNAAGAVGVALGFALGGVNLSPKYQVPIAVFILSFVNLMFLAVRPRILANKAAGIRSVAALRLLLDVLRERPLIVVLVALQLAAVSRSATASVAFLQVASVHSLRDPSDLGFWIVVYSGVMTVVAGIWLASAVGLWCNRNWAWWLALVLNGLAATITGILQLLDWHSYLLDSLAIAALVLLLLPPVRNGFHGIRSNAQRA